VTTFSDYLDAMTDHCPFLRPSLQRGLTRWLRYETNAEAHQLPDLQREIFAAVVEHMELLRNQRRSRPSADAVLLCDNLAIRWIGVQDPTAHRRALAWPHWMLKTSYTPLGYMIGKFSLHDHGTDRRGTRVPRCRSVSCPSGSLCSAKTPSFSTRHPTSPSSSRPHMTTGNTPSPTSPTSSASRCAAAHCGHPSSING
jgi:hypothetical protein